MHLISKFSPLLGSLYLQQGALASGELSTELQRQIAALQEELYGERQRSRELQAALDSAAAGANTALLSFCYQILATMSASSVIDIHVRLRSKLSGYQYVAVSATRYVSRCKSDFHLLQL